MNHDGSTKVAVVGNCQAQALCWYLGKLNFLSSCKYICPDCILGDRPLPMFRDKNIWGDQLSNSIYNNLESIGFLESATHIIYQPIKEETSKIHNYKKIQSYETKACQVISFSDYFYDPKDESKLMGMKDRSRKYNINICGYNIILKNKDKIHGQTKILKDGYKVHPNSFYFLEVILGLCKLTGWDYFSKKDYKTYLNSGYPFDQ